MKRTDNPEVYDDLNDICKFYLEWSQEQGDNLELQKRLEEQGLVKKELKKRTADDAGLDEIEQESKRQKV